MHFLKPQVEASIDVYSNDIYFHEDKPTEVLGLISLQLKRDIRVKSFKVYLIGDLFEMYYGKYPQTHTQAEDDPRDTLRRQFKQSTLIDYRLPYNISHLGKGKHSFPFEIGLYLALETLVSQYALTKYSLRFEMILSDNSSIARFCDLNIVRNIDIKSMNYVGYLMDNMFTYHLDMNNIVFLNKPYHFVLKIGKRENGIDALDISSLQLSIIQTCKIAYFTFNSRSTTADPVDSTSVDQTEELKMGEFFPKPVCTDSTSGDKNKYYRVFDISAQFKDCYEADTRNCLEFVHPTFTSSIFECYHSLKFKVNFNDGLSSSFYHILEIRNRDSLTGNVLPPNYVQNCRDKALDPDAYLLPPHYEDLRI